jgi:purine-binding chemotaxis protein CheW
MPEETRIQLVVFALGGKPYALPITQVQEIIRWLEPRPVSSDGGWVRGVISLRGQIVPVCDLAARLGFAVEDDQTRKIVIADTNAGTAGVIVDEVEEVITVEPDQLDAVPATGADFIDKVAKLGDRLVLLLDADRLLGAAAAETETA